MPLIQPLSSHTRRSKRTRFLLKNPKRLAVAERGRGCGMLAFDIETFGLDPKKVKITVICTECIFTGERKTFEFARHDAEVGGAPTALVADLVATLDAAQSLSAFNGIRFDLPFMQVALGIPEATVRAWVLKTTDILECCRLVHGHTFKLDLLCETNGMPMKSGTGLFAIQLAREGRWDELNAYCADDVAILCNLHRQQLLTNPRTQKKMDLAEWSHPLLYDTLAALRMEEHDDV